MSAVRRALLSKKVVSPCLKVYIYGIYRVGFSMADTGIAKLFRNGRSQAVRLPREFRFEGNQVRVRHVAGGVLLEPFISDAPEWFAELDRLNSGSFMRTGRKQPRTPPREIFKQCIFSIPTLALL